MDQGALVPAELTCDLVIDRIQQDVYKRQLCELSAKRTSFQQQLFL